MVSLTKFEKIKEYRIPNCEYMNVNDLTPYENNNRIHTSDSIESIKLSIEKYGFRDPISVWGKDNIIIEGHGRLLAAKELGFEYVPIIRNDNMTEKERRAYAIAHNATAEKSEWDLENLQIELKDLPDLQKFDFNFGIDFDYGESKETSKTEENSKYTNVLNIPQYEITGEKPVLNQLIDKSKTEKLIKEIKESPIDDEIKDFLIYSSYRHLVFDYSKIAEFYAHTDEKTQELMEKSALVIIDFDDAIKNGYVELSKKLEEMYEKDKKR